MLSKVAAQGALLIVHLNVAVLPAATVTAVFGKLVSVIEAVPLTILQTPVPTVAVLAVMLNVLELHCSMFAGPALATVVGAVLVSVISDCVVGQDAPLVTVHLNVALAPEGTPVIVVVADVALVITAVPVTTLQEPVPTVGEVAAMVKVPLLHCVILEPATDALAGA
jgi:hypothetical protein